MRARAGGASEPRPRRAALQRDGYASGWLRQQRADTVPARCSRAALSRGRSNQQTHAARRVNTQRPAGTAHAVAPNSRRGTAHMRKNLGAHALAVALHRPHRVQRQHHVHGQQRGRGRRGRRRRCALPPLRHIKRLNAVQEPARPAVRAGSGAGIRCTAMPFTAHPARSDSQVKSTREGGGTCYLSRAVQRRGQHWARNQAPGTQQGSREPTWPARRRPFRSRLGMIARPWARSAARTPPPAWPRPPRPAPAGSGRTAVGRAAGAACCSLLPAAPACPPSPAAQESWAGCRAARSRMPRCLSALAPAVDRTCRAGAPAPEPTPKRCPCAGGDGSTAPQAARSRTSEVSGRTGAPAPCARQQNGSAAGPAAAGARAQGAAIY